MTDAQETSVRSLEKALPLLRSVQTLEGTDKDSIECLLERALETLQGGKWRNRRRLSTIAFYDCPSWRTPSDFPCLHACRERSHSTFSWPTFSFNQYTFSPNFMYHFSHSQKRRNALGCSPSCGRLFIGLLWRCIRKIQQDMERKY
jgi:hypothetical protein